MLEGQPFTIYTDHKPLTYVLGKVADGWTTMQCRQLSYVAEFPTDIRHVPWCGNMTADTLSRPPPATFAGPDSCQPALHVQPALHDQPAFNDHLQSTTSLHTIWLLFLLAWSCWTTSA